MNLIPLLLDSQMKQSVLNSHVRLERWLDFVVVPELELLLGLL